MFRLLGGMRQVPLPRPDSPHHLSIGSHPGHLLSRLESSLKSRAQFWRRKERALNYHSLVSLSVDINHLSPDRR